MVPFFLYAFFDHQSPHHIYYLAIREFGDHLAVHVLELGMGIALGLVALKSCFDIVRIV